MGGREESKNQIPRCAALIIDKGIMQDISVPIQEAGARLKETAVASRASTVRKGRRGGWGASGLSSSRGAESLAK